MQSRCSFHRATAPDRSARQQGSEARIPRGRCGDDSPRFWDSGWSIGIVPTKERRGARPIRRAQRSRAGNGSGGFHGDLGSTRNRAQPLSAARVRFLGVHYNPCMSRDRTCRIKQYPLELEAIDRKHPTGRVRDELLSIQGRLARDGETQLIQSPENLGRFTLFVCDFSFGLAALASSHSVDREAPETACMASSEPFQKRPGMTSRFIEAMP